MLAPALRPVPSPSDADGGDDELLDAYSVAVSTAAERLIPSVASLRVTRQVGGWSAVGAGSAVAIEPVGYLVTSAHVVAGRRTRHRDVRRRRRARPSRSSVATRCRTWRSCGRPAARHDRPHRSATPPG